MLPEHIVVIMHALIGSDYVQGGVNSAPNCTLAHVKESIDTRGESDVQIYCGAYATVKPCLSLVWLQRRFGLVAFRYVS